MSEVKVNKISPRTNCGTVTLGDSGDTFTIPAGVSISNSGTASGFGSTGEVSWVTTTKTTTFTATAGEGYFCDTSSGAFTVNLPAGTAGNSFAVADYTNTFQTHNLTIAPNGSQKIGGVAAEIALNTEGQSAYFVYVDDTEGWKNVIDSTSNITGNPFLVASGGTESTSGNYKIHKFTGPGTFTVSKVSSTAAENIVSYMVIAGGGASAGSGSGFNAVGGGGAGGFREYKGPADCYTASPLNGNPGGTAVTVTAQAYSTITSAGGGRGGTNCAPRIGEAGGSGGGTGGGSSCGSSRAAGNTPPVTPSQGNPGGSSPGGPPDTGAGGGGGAGAAGSDAAGVGGNGGVGVDSSITAVSTGYGGGGGGGAGPPQNTAGTGVKGGGNGGTYTNPGSGGTANTGGGGGGAGLSANTPGANGGSGIIVIRYKFQ
jgi:hypothetical protein